VKNFPSTTAKIFYLTWSEHSHGCRELAYCSRECQKEDWILRHKNACASGKAVRGISMPLKDIRATLQAQALGDSFFLASRYNIFLINGVEEELTLGTVFDSIFDVAYLFLKHVSRADM
jgi:hypothetical protein